MNIQFISHLISNIGCSAIIAFFFIRIDKANIIIKSNAKTKKDIIALSFFFSLLSISGTYIGLNFNGAILNTRNVGVIEILILALPCLIDAVCIKFFSLKSKFPINLKCFASFLA